MSQPLLFALCTLTAYRLTKLVVHDSILDRPRERIFDRFPPTSERARVRVDWQMWGARPAAGAYMVPREPYPSLFPPTGYRPISKLGQLLECPWCVSVWLSAGIIGTLVLGGHYGWFAVPLPLPLLWWGAMSAAVGIIDTAVNALVPDTPRPRRERRPKRAHWWNRVEHPPIAAAVIVDGPGPEPLSVIVDAELVDA